MTIYVTRHGQSLTNIDADLELGPARKARGKKPFPITIRNNILTPTGIQQAMCFAKVLQDRDIELDEIICSPLARTKQTAYTIASMLGTLVPIHYNNRFREIEWDVGGKFDRLENMIPGFDSKTLPVNERPIVRNRDLPVTEHLTDNTRGVISLESQEDVYNRVIPEFVRVAKKAKKQNILIVTHFFPVRSIESFMIDGTTGNMLASSPKNLCLNVYEAEDVLARA